jgi:hypothetical protein
MGYTLPMLLVLSSTVWTAKTAQYLPSIQLETCFKGERPTASQIRVLGSE